METIANLSTIIIRQLLETGERIVFGFNSPETSFYSDLNAPIVADSALFTTFLYFTMLAILNNIDPS